MPLLWPVVPDVALTLVEAGLGHSGQGGFIPHHNERSLGTGHGHVQAPGIGNVTNMLAATLAPDLSEGGGTKHI